MVTIISVLGVLGAACLWPTDADPSRQEPGVLVSPQAPRDTALALTGDTYLRSGEPNQNFGAESILRVRPTGKNRALFQVDRAVLAAAVGAGAVTAARLELTITDNGDNWGASGRVVVLHRLTGPWTESGATWNCGVDTVPGNPQAECAPGTAWEMGTAGPNPWVGTPTATVTIANGQAGVVTFDVTGDVVAWLGESLNAGWILKREDEGPSGAVEFGSRESVAPPRLVLTLVSQQGGWPVLTDYPQLDTSRVVVVQADTDTIMYFRTEIRLRFKSGVSDSAKALFLAARSMSVIGVIDGGALFVRMPDPGPTLEDYYRALDALRAAAEVDIVAPLVRTAPRLVHNARYPVDGPGQARSDWLDTSGTTWALRAIRAPLAWGCETGDYGGALVRVGLFEWKHQALHPDYARSAPKLWEPSDAELAQFSPRSGLAVREAEQHAAATTGLFTAEGDNRSGLAGVNWRTRVHLYSGMSAGNRALPLSSGLYRLADALSADSLRVLNISVDERFGSQRPDDIEATIRDVARDIQLLILDRMPSLVIVLAGGNDRYRGTIQAYVRSPRAALVLGAFLLLKAEQPQYGRRIIVVPGTRPGGRFWDIFAGDPLQGSNSFAGLMDIAAPAEDVTVLDRWTGQSGSSVPLRAATGTSLAAPQVAGTVSLLWSMDPSLPGDSLKDYVLRGAREPRLDPRTGDLVSAVAVTGAPETIYQLDAYGALTLLSRERPATTPLCGGQVWVSGDSVLVSRGETLPPRVVQVPTQYPDFASVAQGGRRIAVTDFDGDRVLVLNPQGAVEEMVSGVYARQYLERGTADLRWVLVGPASERRLLLDIEGTGTAALDSIHDLDLGDGIAPEAQTRNVDWVAISPTGEWAAVQSFVEYDWTTYEIRVELVTLLSGRTVPAFVFRGEPGGPCNSPYGATDCPGVNEGGVAWAHDGRRFVVPVGYDDKSQYSEILAIRTRVIEVPLVNGIPQPNAPSAPFEGVWLFNPRLTADDILLVSEDVDWLAETCVETRRLPFAPFTTRETHAPVTPAACVPLQIDGPRIFNAPPRAIARGALRGRR